MGKMFENDTDRRVWELLSITIEVQAWIHNHVPAKDLPLDMLERHMGAIARVTAAFENQDQTLTQGEDRS